MGPKKEDGSRNPVVPCPERVCGCKAGAEPRKALKERVAKQANYLAKLGAIGVW